MALMCREAGVRGHLLFLYSNLGKKEEHMAIAERFGKAAATQAIQEPHCGF